MGTNDDASLFRRTLDLSARAVIEGTKCVDITWEPIGATGPTDNEVQRMREEVLARDGGCVYCGLVTTTMQVDSLNDNHHDLDPANNVAADPICHGYHHLSELSDGAARVAYLPGLSAVDVNHLQRLAAINLFHGTDDQKRDARDLVNWLASHAKYTKDAFGSASPAAYATVLNQVDPEIRLARTHVFRDLSLVYNPTQFREIAATWHVELAVEHPRLHWPAFFHDVMRLS